jgi:hypothetical protein
MTTMNHYVTPDNKKYGFDDTQTDLIPPDAVLIPDTIPIDQVQFVELVDGVPVVNQTLYDDSLKQVCKATASDLLYKTDWTTIPDIVDPSMNPHLLNLSEFMAYRSQVRALAVNPVTNPVFPPEPVAQWSS